MDIGYVPDPHNWDRWAEAEALLDPARARGDFASVLEDDELLWAVMDGDDLLACATAWMGEGFVEVKLVGGRDRHRWLEELDNRIGHAALEAGATELRAWGRLGWIKSLQARGWETIKLEDGGAGYRRRLGV